MATGFRSVLFPLGLNAAPSVPGAPGSLTATAGPGQIILTWTAAAANPSAPVTAYNVYRSTTSGGETLLTTLGVVLTYTDTTAMGGATYYYKVSATNSIGEGTLSSEVSAQVLLSPARGGTPPGVTYSARAYNAYGWPIGRLRLASVDAGRVVNGVATAQITAVGPLAVWWQDIQYIDLWRHAAGASGRWECYQVRQWDHQWNNGADLYIFAGRGLAQFMTGRSVTVAAMTAQASIANLAARGITEAIGSYPMALPVVTLALSGPQTVVDSKQTNQKLLAGLQSLANVSKAMGAPAGAPELFNFAVSPVIRADGSLALGVATWGGEYGEDRRANGANPVVLWLKTLTDTYTVSRDESSIVTAIRMGSAANPAFSQSIIKNDAVLESPYGNYWAESSTLLGATGTLAAYAKMWSSRPLTKLTLEIKAPDRFGLGLGDIVSVVDADDYMDGRVNVMHAKWDNAGEQLTARIDIEVT